MYLQDWGLFVLQVIPSRLSNIIRTINQSPKYTNCHVQDQALLHYPSSNPYGSIWSAHPLRSQHSRTHELLFILVAIHLQCHLLWSWLYDHRDLPAQLLKGLGDPKFRDSSDGAKNASQWAEPMINPYKTTPAPLTPNMEYGNHLIPKRDMILAFHVSFCCGVR